MYDPIPRTGTFFFWCGLVGILATGLMVGMGGDNYWALAGVGSLDPHVSSPRGQVFMFMMAVFAALFDLIAIGVVVAGGAAGVQRLRGRT
jgi:hypothetical protein